MSRMDHSIILRGQQPDIIGSFARGQQARALADERQNQNALRNVFQTQGADILAGNQNALNALAQHDPGQALAIRGQHQAQARANETHQMRIDEYVRSLDAATAAAEAAKVEAGLTRAIGAYQAGDLNGVNAILQSAGEQPIQSLEQFPAIVAVYGDVLGKLKSVQEITAGPKHESDREIARLMELGLDRNTAIKIKEGGWVFKTDPVTGEHTLMDVSTGQPVAQVSQQPSVQQPEETKRYSFGSAFENSDRSFGIGGMIRGGVNAAADAVGAEVPFPEVQTTQSDFAVLQEQLVNDIAGGYNRQPPSWLLKNIRELTPTAGTFAGSEGAQSKLKALGRSLEGERNRIEKSMKRRMKPAEREKLAGRLSALDAALGRVSEALGSFGGSEIRPEVADRLRNY